MREAVKQSNQLRYERATHSKFSRQISSLTVANSKLCAEVEELKKVSNAAAEEKVSNSEAEVQKVNGKLATQ
eukprot:6197270-Pleurochrysis_carterae.AAC.1